jgi:hypothetical protein
MLAGELAAGRYPEQIMVDLKPLKELVAVARFDRDLNANIEKPEVWELGVGSTNLPVPTIKIKALP